MPTSEDFGNCHLGNATRAVAFFFKGGWLLLDNIQDPGNVGTMIRTADAAGLAGVILGKGTARYLQYKSVALNAGSHYHLPVLQRRVD